MSDDDTVARGPVDLLVEHATLVATVDENRREIPGGWVAVDNGLVSAVGGPGAEPRPGTASTPRVAWSHLASSTPTITCGRT